MHDVACEVDFRIARAEELRSYLGYVHAVYYVTAYGGERLTCTRTKPPSAVSWTELDRVLGTFSSRLFPLEIRVRFCGHFTLHAIIIAQVTQFL